MMNAILIKEPVIYKKRPKNTQFPIQYILLFLIWNILVEICHISHMFIYIASEK